MMDRFSIEVETIYHNDVGTKENVFGLQGDQLSSRVVDVMNFVKASLSDVVNLRTTLYPKPELPLVT